MIAQSIDLFALQEMVIEGIKTTIPFHRKLLGNVNFVSSQYDINFVDDKRM